MKEYVLVTGATSGIGLELAKLYGEKGNNLILVGRNKARLHELKSEIQGVEIITHSLDLSILSNIDVLIEYISSRNLNISILINNAGAGFNGEFLDIPWDKHHTIIDLNIKSLTKLTYGILKMMKKRSSGKILNVASTGAYQPGPLIGVYYATKAYVLSFSSALREEVGGYGINISTLCPGATKTNFSKRAGKGDLSVAMDPKFVAKVAYIGMEKNKAIIVPGMMNKVLVFFSKVSPTMFNAGVVKKYKARLWIQKNKFFIII